MYHHNKLDFSKVKWTTEPIQNSYGAILEENLREYGKRLRILTEKTRELGAIPIFVTQPAGYYRVKENVIEGMDMIIQYDDIFINGLDNYNILKRYNEVTMSICKEQEAICFDLANDVIWKEDDFNDAIHMSPSGMTKIADYLFDNLKVLYEK